MTYNKICAFCNNKYTAQSLKFIYCSKSCVLKAFRRKESRNVFNKWKEYNFDK